MSSIVSGNEENNNSSLFTENDNEAEYATSIEEPLMKNDVNNSIIELRVCKMKSSSLTEAKKTHQFAVMLNDVSCNYGKICVLRNVTSRMRRGEIYGLLGPSGCGKTTLLRCIVGVTVPKSGQITVFGEKPGSSQSSIPGPGVGYMPQDIALYGQFTISETIDYFGVIFGMSNNIRKKRLELIINFLDLPNSNRQISALSGGEKRRVSLAAALIHNPPLLILDEPTVGVDPLLRESIWHYLIELTQTEKMTIIITTHYIEEARQANQIGLMREGQLLIEDEPNYLLEKYEKNNLESTFLKVCELAKNSPEIFNQQRKRSQIEDEVENNQLYVPISKKFQNVNNLNKIGALMKKGIIRLQRNWSLLLLQTFVPVIQIMLFCLCVGGDPYDLNVAVYNPDQNYSLRFISEIDPKQFNLINYASFDSALDAVKNGHASAALTFDANYTRCVNKRFELLANINNETQSKCKIKVHADMTEFPIQLTVFHQMMNASERYMQKLIKDTPIHLPENDWSWGTKIAETFFEHYKDDLKKQKDTMAEPFIDFVQPPVYGSAKASFRDYTVAGVIPATSYVLSAGLTALVLVGDRKGGQFERTVIAGVHPLQILVAHVVVQIALNLLQIALLFLGIFVVFNIELKGNLILVTALTLLQGISGISFGFLCAAFSKEEQLVILIIFSSFYSNLILSGIFWPLEAMPISLQYIGYVMPQTFSVKAFRAIMFRGHGLWYMDVWLGFASSIAWIVILNFCAIIVLVFKK